MVLKSVILFLVLKSVSLSGMEIALELGMNLNWSGFVEKFINWFYFLKES